jgi:hypothetical protein
MSKKKSAPVRAQSDRKLALRLLNLRDDYGILYQDPDGYRLGKSHFEIVGSEMKKGAKEVFNRVVQDGQHKHRPLKPLFDGLARLSATERRDAEEVYQVLRGINREDIPSVAFIGGKRRENRKP